MRTLTHSVQGQTSTIHIPETSDDIGGFEKFLAQGDKVLGFDTEDTSLDIFAPGFKCRAAQFGNPREAWVLDAQKFPSAIARALRQDRYFVAHNAPFDLLVADRHLGVPLEELAERVFDTRILGHLLDPRMAGEGGTGLKLKQLSEIYVDPDAADTQDGLTREFNRLGFTKETGWSRIPFDNELYQRYAGLDVIYVSALLPELANLIKGNELDELSEFEHHLQILLAVMMRKGMRIDVDYTESLRTELRELSDRYKLVAKRYGVENVNSTKQVSTALVAMGENLSARTPSGGLKVDAEVLLDLADMDREWHPRESGREPSALADAVLRAKRAGKWAVTYADSFIRLRDEDDRIHPSIGGLQARTARMSVSRPPLQQLPSSDWTIRRCFIADPGMSIISCDYSQIEMRVLAALSEDEALIADIVSGEDLHDAAATRVFGEHFSKQQRKLAKIVGFSNVYGGGVRTIVKQTGADPDRAKAAVDIYNRQYPAIKRYGRQLQRAAEFGKTEIVTPSGRHLPLDKDRLYSATNYVVQSTARDIFAQGIVDLFDAGLGDYLLLPVHDEMVAQAPVEDAEEIARAIGEAMNGEFFGLPIVSDPEVAGPSWGSAYGCPPDRDYVEGM